MDRAEIAPGILVTNDRCLIFRDQRTLVIGDLHLGYEKALEEDGVYLPRLNTGSVRIALNNLICKYEPERIVLLGDIKHDFRRAKYEGRDEVRAIVSLVTEAAEAVIVRGNHDNYIQNIIADMDLEAVDHYDIAGYRLEHGHEDSGHRPVVIGHEHPSVRIPGAVGGGVKLQCFLHMKKEGIIVIPPFSPLSTGTDLLPVAAGDFMSPACRTADVSAADVYAVSEMGLLPLGRLGEVSEIRV